MISYNPKEWFAFIFNFHKQIFSKTVSANVGIAAYSGLVAFLKLSTGNFLKLVKLRMFR
jgi:putative membrane protein